MQYFFHAAETNWYKARKSNIYDALLLNTTRIGKRGKSFFSYFSGHGFAVMNYPFLQDEIKQRGIAIEVCPISNQLLRVVYDIREHPAREMLSNGLAITISNDDSAIYGMETILHP